MGHSVRKPPCKNESFYGYDPVDVIHVPGERGKQGLTVRGPQGKPGPKGNKGDPGRDGLGVGDTDSVPEGDINLYFTHDRAEAVAQSVVAVHVALPDPHPEYLDDDDLIDGGNF